MELIATPKYLYGIKIGHFGRFIPLGHIALNDDADVNDPELLLVISGMVEDIIKSMVGGVIIPTIRPVEVE